MCGIAGIISLDKSSFQSNLIVEMCDRMYHRGPDGEGFLFGGQSVSELLNKRTEAIVNKKESARPFAFGHRRLSIIDLSNNAGQPMADITDRYHIVFNGEIYNHAELRAELEKEGKVFKTDHSDTEVVLNAYAAWGKDCLHRFNGMFALCIWDSQKDSFFMARDRLGIKPFYYCMHNNSFYFASELRAILTDKTISTDLDERAVYDYLTYIASPPPNTLIKSIKKLPAGYYLEIINGDLSKPKQYWDILEKTKIVKRSEKELTTKILELFDSAAKRRMVADVEVGVLLSGGVDSSANLAMLSKHTDKKIKAFSIGFDNSISGYKNEFEYSRLVAKRFNTEYFEIKIEKEKFSELLLEMLVNQDEPIADTANIPIYLIAQKAKEEGVTVLLGGEGSDELLLGYSHWQFAKKYHSIFEKRKGIGFLANILQHIPYKDWYNKSFKRWYEKTCENKTVFWSGTEIRTEKQKSKNIIDKSKIKLNGYHSFDGLEDLFNNFKSCDREDYFDWMSYSDLNFRLPELLLARLDRMTMLASIEGRVPFMDHEFAEFCMTIDPAMKVKNGESKYLLKKAFEGILPDNILYRPKEGFVVPMESLLFDSEHSEYFQREIEKFNKTTGFFKIDYLKKLVENKNGGEFWNILNLCMWYNNVRVA